MKRILLTTAISLFAAAAAHADATTDGIVANFQSLGYTGIEVKVGPTQIKAEGVKDGVKREVIFDRATGKILKDESEAAGTDDSTSSGVEVEVEDDDFLDDDSGHHSGSDDGDDDSNDDSDDDSDDDSGHGGNSGSGGGGNSGHGGGSDDD